MISVLGLENSFPSLSVKKILSPSILTISFSTS
jgi:hypothetical protein